MNLRTGLALVPLAVLALTGCSATSAPSTTAGSATAAAAPSASASASYRMGDVAAHNTAQDCWVAVDDGVYDVTSWISRHPGGPDKITGLCGTDATDAFRTQHDSQEKPNQQLASFRIGTLVD